MTSKNNTPWPDRRRKHAFFWTYWKFPGRNEKRHGAKNRRNSNTGQNKKREPSSTQLTGILSPGKEMANASTAEMARGAREAPPYIPIVAVLLTDRPWMPSEPSFTRSHDNWKQLQTTHKRPCSQPPSFQTFVLNYLRFVLAGDLAAAWAKFGGLSAQLAHFGAILSISATETASIAISYGRSVRAVIETESRKRISADQRFKLIKMLTEVHDVAKKQALRDQNVIGQGEKQTKTAIKTNGRYPLYRRPTSPPIRGRIHASRATAMEKERANKTERPVTREKANRPKITRGGMTDCPTHGTPAHNKTTGVSGPITRSKTRIPRKR